MSILSLFKRKQNQTNFLLKQLVDFDRIVFNTNLWIVGMMNAKKAGWHKLYAYRTALRFHYAE